MNNLYPLQKGIIYGPVNSKRLGRSLGINLFPATKKVCTFDCAYCHYGITTEKTLKPNRSDLPTIEQVSAAVEQTLKSPLEFDYITFSGNGEPMLHPDFTEIVRRVKELKDKYRPTIPLTLLSNSSCLVNRIDIDPAPIHTEVKSTTQYYSKNLASYKYRCGVDTLSLIENRIFKLDCADDDTFRFMNNAVKGVTIADIINALEKVSMVLPITIQTVFIDGAVKNYTGEVFQKWLEVIKRIKPQKIQIYSTDRPVANSNIQMISDDKLAELAENIIQETQIPTTAYKAQKKR